MRKRATLFLGLLTASIALTSQSTAHETWASSVLLIQFGEGGKLDTYHPEKISLLSAIDSSGKDINVKGKAIGDASLIVKHPDSEKPAAVFYTIAYDPYIIKGEEWIKSTHEEIHGAEKTWQGSYTSTSLFTWTDALKENRERLIEIVPQTNPLILKEGEILPLIIYYNGKPLSGATVYLDEETTVKSDEAGEVKFPVSGKRQIIICSYSEENGQHTVFHGAALSFNL